MHLSVTRYLAVFAIMLGLVATLVPRTALAADFVKNEIVVVITDNLNLRSDAGTDGEVLGVYSNGARFLIVEGPRADDGYDWYRVTGIGDTDTPQTGWVASDFIAAEDDSDTPTGFEDALGIRIVDEPVNLRSEPGLDGFAFDALYNGKSYPTIQDTDLVSKDGYEWIKIRQSTLKTGWVATDFVEPLDFAPELPTTAPETEFDDASGVRVVDGPVNVRQSPGLDRPVETTLATGVEIPVNTGSIPRVMENDGLTWIAVLYGNGKSGNIAIDYLDPLDYTPNLGSDDGWSTSVGVEVIDGPVNFRETPSSTGEILGTLPTGSVSARFADTELVTANGYTWVKIKRLSTPSVGWLAIDFLKPLEDLPCMDGACYPEELDPFYGIDGVVVTDGPLNLREAPGTGESSLMTLAEGDYLNLESVLGPYEADGYLWLKVSVSGEVGYVAIDFVRPAE